IIWLLRKEKNKKIWLLFYIQFFLLLTTIPRPDFYHISLILFPIYSILPISIEKIKTFNFFKKRYYYLIISLTIFLVLFPLILIIANYPSFFYSIKKSKIISYIKNNCQNSVYLYAGPFIPGLYFETKKLNPSPYSFLITNQQTKEQFSETKEMIKKYRPSCAVLNYKIVERFNYNKNNPVDNYILNNYKFVFQEGNTLLYKKILLSNE
ncbi:MAG: hypothetical protein ABH808_00215, partial [Candidatus Kuenenbacteria bacterium]